MRSQMRGMNGMYPHWILRSLSKYDLSYVRLLNWLRYDLKLTCAMISNPMERKIWNPKLTPQPKSPAQPLEAVTLRGGDTENDGYKRMRTWQLHLPFSFHFSYSPILFARPESATL